MEKSEPGKIIGLKARAEKATTFVTQTQLDMEMANLSGKIANAMDLANKLTNHLLKLGETYNDSMSRQDGNNAEFARLIQGNRHDIEQLKLQLEPPDDERA